MRNFFRDVKGAVTVMVTLLLVPAILVSGTAVDLARVYSARSIVQDANQLAANAVLTQYHSMLQDAYGLYGVMESDPILGNALNNYIRVSIFGEETQDRSLGTFQVFYGSSLQNAGATPAAGQNLANIAVMRRQIEEYSKFRAPVIIMEEIWTRIETFKTLKADADAIEQKMAIDKKIDQIDQIYEDIYYIIQTVNGYPADQSTAFRDVNLSLGQINLLLQDLSTTRKACSEAARAANETQMSDLEAKYKGLCKNLTALVKGGSIGSTWVPGDYDDNGNWADGAFAYWDSVDGLNKQLRTHKDILSKYTDSLDKLLKKCEAADKKKAELKKMVDNLERKLNNGCSDELVDAMTKEQDNGKGGTQASVLEEYRALLAYSLTEMAAAVKAQNEPVIQEAVRVLSDVMYASIENNTATWPSISLSGLAEIGSNIFDLASENAADGTSLENLAALRDYQYTEPSGYKRFEDSSFSISKNPQFYDLLEQRYGAAAQGNKEKKKSETSNILKLLSSAQKRFQDICTKLELLPDGALYYKENGEAGANSGLGHDGDWSKDGEASDKVQSALKNDMLSQVGDFFNNAGNTLLLLTYDSEMFSNFTTVVDTKNMSGTPMNTANNYFFQSELEYLYNGNEKSAQSNLATVSSMIFLIRFVCNYISTFTISEIRSELRNISLAAGPYAAIVRELARLAYALAESVIDMDKLLSKPSCAVPVFKNNIKDWTFSLGNLASSVPTSMDEFLSPPKDTGNGMYYIDYLRIALLLKDPNTLAQRTRQLIEWNITNRKHKVNADEGVMATVPLFDLSKLHTGFTVESRVDMRMLFLSMPFAQKGVKGVIPPKTLPLTVVDYRGY